MEDEQTENLKEEITTIQIGDIVIRGKNLDGKKAIKQILNDKTIRKYLQSYEFSKLATTGGYWG